MHTQFTQQLDLTGSTDTLPTLPAAALDLISGGMPVPTTPDRARAFLAAGPKVSPKVLRCVVQTAAGAAAGAARGGGLPGALIWGTAGLVSCLP